ncbi:ABC transporter substrate-binding protein [Kaarinaea lacus]
MTQINIMALRHSAFYTPLLMTMAAGFLKKEGLEPVYTPATPDNTVPDNIRSGRCHMAQSAVATSFEDCEQGRAIDIVHFAQINQRDGFFLAGRDPEPGFEWKNLEGKKVLVDHFFQPLAMMKYGLYKQGVDWNSIDVIDAGDVDAIEKAYRNGVGDYVHQQGPAPQQMEFDGIAHVVAAVGDAVGPVAFSSLCASRDWLKSEMADSFMNAYQNSLRFVQATSADELAQLHQAWGFFTNIHPEVLTNTIDAYKSLGCWSDDYKISQQSYENLLDVFLYNKLIKRRYPYGDVIVEV